MSYFKKEQIDKINAGGETVKAFNFMTFVREIFVAQKV